MKPKAWKNVVLAVNKKTKTLSSKPKKNKRTNGSQDKHIHITAQYIFETNHYESIQTQERSPLICNNFIEKIKRGMYRDAVNQLRLHRNHPDLPKYGQA